MGGLAIKPLIGITASVPEGKLTISQDMVDSVAQAGGLVAVLPHLREEAEAAAYLDRMDGLLVSGGPDIDPLLFGEEPHPALGFVEPGRDRSERWIVRAALERDMPIFAICRGAQLLNAAAGGSLYQDLPAQLEGAMQHAQRAPRDHLSHYIETEPGTLLHRIVGESRLKVNSFHHQAVKRLASGFRVSAKSSDGVVEAYESERHAYVIGVQWHPENLTKLPEYEAARKLFGSFVRACEGGRK